MAVTALANFKAYFLLPLDDWSPSFLNCKECVISTQIGFFVCSLIISKPTISTICWLYPYILPLSQITTSSQPKLENFWTINLIWSGDKNWGFLIFIGLPVLARAWIRSVWRAKKAGSWSISQISATLLTWLISWISVSIGTFKVSFSSLNISKPFLNPGPL